MTPDQRIHNNLERICNAAGVSMMHCTEDQLAAMREEMRQIMKESYIPTAKRRCEATSA